MIIEGSSKMAIKKTMVKLFEKSADVGPQPNLLKMLKVEYLRMNFNEFASLFMDLTMSVIITETTIHCPEVNNAIKFAANGVSILSEHTTKDGRSGLYLISEFLKLFRLHGSAKDKTIRWRFCLFINHLLNHMSGRRVLSVDIREVATLSLLERLKDKKSEIRVQAARSLHLLQTPDNPKCKIVKKFMFHMTCDSSVEVRSTVVKEIAMFNYVLDEMLKHSIYDVSDNVRKEAYNRFLNYPFLRLSSKQRQTILEKGLIDKNAFIKLLVKKQFLVKWLNECNNDFEVFLNNLGVENEIVCEKALYIIFETYYDSQVLDLINKYLNSDSRMIAFNELTVEKIFLWKCVAKYLTTEKKIELVRNQGHVDDNYIDVLLPYLVNFSNYIRKYYFNSTNSKEFILTQLLDMTREFVIDDVGAESLNKLCLDLILDDHMPVKPIKSVVVLLDLTFKNGQDLLNYVKQILNTIQIRTIDVYPLVDKVGKEELFKHQLESKTNAVEELLKDEPSSTDKIERLIFKLKKIKKQYKEINVLPEEKILVDIALKNILKVLELVFQVQQLPKVGTELFLLTDIVQNIVVGYLDCYKVNVRMAAIRSLAPYLLVNNIPAAKEHMNTLCAEIAKPMTDRHLVLKIMFELFLRYDLKTFDMNDDLDTDEFSAESILQLLVNCIDYDFDDSSYKSVVIKGFCNLLIFKKVKSICLLSKLLILLFKHTSEESFSLYHHLVEFFTTYVFYIDSSSSLLAMCYVPVLKEIDEYNLSEKLNIEMDEVNSTLINLTNGLMYMNEKEAINAHGELACYILDYLLDENQPYTAMLVDTLCELEIDFDSNNKLINTIGQQLLCVIKYFEFSNDRNDLKYLKKIINKFDPVLQKKESFMKKNNEKEVDAIEMDTEQTQVPSTINQAPHSVEDEEDLFIQEILIESSSDEEDSFEMLASRKLKAMKCMSADYKRSLNTNTYILISENDELNF